MKPVNVDGRPGRRLGDGQAHVFAIVSASKLRELLRVIVVRVEQRQSWRGRESLCAERVSLRP